MMIKIFACFILSCVVLTFGVRQKRITYGRKVFDSEFLKFYPYMTFLQVCDGDGCTRCTGTLVSPYRILTAANCFCNRVAPPTVKIMYHGLWSGQKTTGHLMKSDLEAYECQKPDELQAEKDIAVVGLNSPIYTTPVKLLCERNAATLFDSGKMLGYGLEPALLHIANAKSLQCPIIWRKENRICTGAGADNPESQLGDHGGPLLIRHQGEYMQVGIFSKKMPVTKKYQGYDSLQVWASVAPHCRWIKTVNISAYSVGQRVIVGMTELVIQLFVVVIALHF